MRYINSPSLLLLFHFHSRVVCLRLEGNLVFRNYYKMNAHNFESKAWFGYIFSYTFIGSLNIRRYLMLQKLIHRFNRSVSSQSFSFLTTY